MNGCSASDFNYIYGEKSKMKEATFERAGKSIFYRTWADVKTPKGIIQIAHGMVEHTLRYDAVAQRLNTAGYIVVADEHRGHGRTDPDTLGYCEGDMYRDTLEDIHELMILTKRKYPGLPYFLFGFSYGSFLTQSFLGKYSKELTGAIIGGSNKQPHAVAVLGKALSKSGCNLYGEKAPAKLMREMTFGLYNAKFQDKEFLSTNPESNRIYHADPFCSYTCSYQFYYSFMSGLSELYSKEYAKNLIKDLPILILSGEQDAVGDMGLGPRKLQRYYQKIGCKYVDLKLYKNSRHEFLNEDVTRTDDIVNFCDEIIDR